MMKSRIDINPALRGTVIGTLAGAVASCGLPDACEIIYRGRNVLALLESAGLVIKCYAVPGFIKGLIYSWFRTPKSLRAYRNALKLQELGIPTPAPAFAIENYSHGRLTTSYYACEALVGWNDIHDVEQRPDFPEIARALAEFIYRMHAQGVMMLDMNPGNILFREKEGGGWEFSLVDINRMYFGEASRRRLVENNFRALTDTVEGSVAVACEYGRLLERDGIDFPGGGDMGRRARAIYEDFFRRRRRKYAVKNFFRGKK